MPTVDIKYSIPQNSSLKKFVSDFHYCDSFSIVTQTSKSVENITLDVFEISNWVEYLLKIRNFLVKPFGLYISTNKRKDKVLKLPFKVLEKSKYEIVMGETDKHLDFWVSVLKCDQNVMLTTVVKFHNLLGRVYFLPVKPFHKLIVYNSLKNFGRDN